MSESNKEYISFPKMQTTGSTSETSNREHPTISQQAEPLSVRATSKAFIKSRYGLMSIAIMVLKIFYF